MPLPQEIIDEILGQLQTDKDTLCTCSLVCQTWLPYARHHLFRQVSLNPSPRTALFLDLITGRPDIARLVRDFDLRGRAPSSRGWWEGHSSSTILWPELAHGRARRGRGTDRSDATSSLLWLRRTFSPIPSGSAAAPRFPRVHTLRLSEFTLNPDTATFLATAFPHLTTLSLDGCRTMSFAEFVEVLQAFPLLRTLRLLWVEWLHYHLSTNTESSTESNATQSTANHGSPVPLPHLTHLEFSRDIGIEPLLHWLMDAAGAHTRLRSLECSIAARNSADALRLFLVAAGPTLEHLSITLAEARDPTAILEFSRLDLTPCTALRTLHARCSPARRSADSAAPPSLSWVPILLAKARAPRLAEIRLGVRAADLPRLNLEGLDVVLASARADAGARDGLRLLAFDIADGRGGGGSGAGSMMPDATDARREDERALRGRMPVADAQGLIRVEYTG